MSERADVVEAGDGSHPAPAALGRMFRRAQGAACDRMVRPPDWSPARDLEFCGACGASLLQHAARIAADEYSADKQGGTMKITIENTSKIVELVTEAGAVPARVWEGATDTGIPVHCYVTRIAVARELDASQFARELVETRTPSAPIEALPRRLVL